MKKLFSSQSMPNIKRQHQLIKLGLMVGGIGLLYWLISLGTSETPALQKQKPLVYEGASKALTPQEMWTEKLEVKYEETLKKLDASTKENAILGKKMETLENLLTKLAKDQEESRSFEQNIPVEESKPLQKQMVKESESSSPQGFFQQQDAYPPQNQVFEERSSSGEKIGMLSLTPGDAEQQDTHLRLNIVENTVPAGSHVQAILTSAIAASTSLNASSDPRPITLRLVGPGSLPRGWKSCLKDAVLLGACYGDLSSERMICRLTTMSWVEKNGETVEKEIEGWVVGEDGRFGVRGIVVDRSGEVAREAFISGVLSGFSGFFQAQTTSNVFPVSPFGQTNALSTGQMLQGGAASGVGKALDRLSEFYIKRAESMSPVILINPGRVVDVVFKKGVDLRGSLIRDKISGRAEYKRRQEAQ